MIENEDRVRGGVNPDPTDLCIAGPPATSSQHQSSSSSYEFRKSFLGGSQMVTNVDVPFPPVEVINTTAPLDWATLRDHIGTRLHPGVSFVVRVFDGPPNRGGYFFHLREDDDCYFFSTFTRPDVCTFDEPDACIRLINHVCGLVYDEAMWRLASRINLRDD